MYCDTLCAFVFRIYTKACAADVLYFYTADYSTDVNSKTLNIGTVKGGTVNSGGHSTASATLSSKSLMFTFQKLAYSAA